MANSACAVNLLEESGTLVSHPASPTWRRLTLIHSYPGQIRIQKKEIKSFYQVKGHKELQLQEIDFRSRPKVNSERGKKTDVKKIGLHERLQSFPNEHLCIRGGKLFCNACHELLSTKKSILQNHCKSKKHAQGKEMLVKSKKRDVTITEALKADNASCRLQTSTLPLEVRAFRVQVVEDFLKAGFPLYKIDKLRDLLEKGGNRLTNSSHLRQHIPLTLKQETERLKEEIATRDLGLVFDGSTRLGEAIVIIVRFVSDNWSIVQRLIRLDICTKSVNAQDLAHVLNDCLSVDYQVRGNSLLATMKDGASVNQAALNHIKFVFPKMFIVVCFSHTIDNVGNHFKVPDLLSFGSLWIRLFKNSHRAKLIWQELTGRTPKSYSETRWWSKWEVFEQLLVEFGDVEQFLQEADTAKFVPQIVPQIRETLSDQESRINLQLQLAAIVDVGHHFVTATYYLEGDGPLVFSCHEKLQAVAEACRVPHFPNVRAVSTAIATEDPTQNVATLEQRARACVDPAIQWFLQRFNVQLYDPVAAFKAARIMCPVAVQWMRPTAPTVSALRIFPFFNSDRIIDGLIAAAARLCRCRAGRGGNH